MMKKNRKSGQQEAMNLCVYGLSKFELKLRMKNLKERIRER